MTNRKKKQSTSTAKTGNGQKNSASTVKDVQIEVAPQEQVKEVYAVQPIEGIAIITETAASNPESSDSQEYVFSKAKVIKSAATKFSTSKVGTPLFISNKYGKAGIPLYCMEAYKMNEILIHVIGDELVAFMGQYFNCIPSAEDILQHDSEQSAQYNVDDYLDENRLYVAADLIKDGKKLLDYFISKEHVVTAIAIQRSITRRNLIKKYSNYLPEPEKLLIEAEDKMEEILASARVPRRTSTIMRRKKAASESLPA